MFRTPAFSKKYLFGCGLMLALLTPLGSANAVHTATVLHSFRGGKDGSDPYAGLVSDTNGNLYGTTFSGGSLNYGTIFKLAPDGSETVLYSFKAGNDGANPYGGVIFGVAGQLYGTTGDGGSFGVGTVFELARDGRETVLHSFSGGDADGSAPLAGLTADQAGNLYGTTLGGGPSGFGTVFKVVPGGTETILHFFNYYSDGAYPYSGLIADSAGNLYGTAYYGAGTGCDGNGCGSVFELTIDGTFTVLHSFGGGHDGAAPQAGLVFDEAGNLYGTTQQGGGYGVGTIFEVTASGHERVLFNFTGGRDGTGSVAGLIMDGGHHLYGTTYNGGRQRVGTVFRLDRPRKMTVLFAFDGNRSGGDPMDGLFADGLGNFYGTASEGGAHGYGVVFKLTK